MTFDKLSPETADMFGHGMDRPPMPPPPATPRLTLAQLQGAERSIGRSEPRARSTDPMPSHQAADDVKSKVGKRELEVMRALAERGPSNWDEVTAFTGLRAGTVSPRFKPLCEKGLIFDTGKTAPGMSGSEQTIWALTPNGRTLLGLPHESQLDLL